MYQIISYTLNLHNIICQSYLNKTEEKEKLNQFYKLYSVLTIT